MSRLIDADIVISIAKGEFCEDDLSKILWLIAHVPTAYKADKVVEQLEKSGQKMSEAKSNPPYGKTSPGCHKYYKAISVNKAVEIVKVGGVNE